MINTILSIPVEHYTKHIWLVWAGIGLILFLALIISFTIICSIREKDFDGLAPMLLLDIGLLSGAVFLLTCGILILKSNRRYEEWYATKYTDTVYDSIYSLGLKNEVSGSFVLGCGTVNTDTYYYFYIKSIEDTYKLEKISSDNILIKESNEQPKITQLKEANSEIIYTIIFVPEGTFIQNGYNIV